jgi:pimeloyl-ACP methyl ester carboxylesterase
MRVLLFMIFLCLVDVTAVFAKDLGGWDIKQVAHGTMYELATYFIEGQPAVTHFSDEYIEQNLEHIFFNVVEDSNGSISGNYNQPDGAWKKTADLIGRISGDSVTFQIIYKSDNPRSDYYTGEGDRIEEYFGSISGDTISGTMTASWVTESYDFQEPPWLYVYYNRTWSLTGTFSVTCSPPSSSPEILDGADFTAGNEVSSDPEKLVFGGTPMEGTVTDGVSRLLLRLPVNNSDSATFSLSGTGDPTEDGALRSIDGFNEGRSITVDTVTVGDNNYAFAIYQAPDSFVRSEHEEDKQAAERKLIIQIKVGDSTPIQKDIKLVRPPLILIHGLWSDPSMWAENSFRIKLGTAVPGLRMFAIDYEPTNDRPLIVNKDKVRDEIINVRDHFRAKKIAMVQADVLGHSMGGLLARIWAGSGKNVYFQDCNFGMGDINKLITLDSPHHGAFLADIGTQFINDLIPSVRAAVVAEFRERGRAIDGGAIQDLMTTSEAIKNINSKGIACVTYAIIGNYIVSNEDFWNIPNELGWANSILTSYSILKRDVRFDTRPYVVQHQSDLVVSIESQGGGLDSTASSTFGHYHTSATTDDVLNNTVELLNSSTYSLLKNGFSN